VRKRCLVASALLLSTLGIVWLFARLSLALPKIERPNEVRLDSDSAGNSTRLVEVIEGNAPILSQDASGTPSPLPQVPLRKDELKTLARKSFMPRGTHASPQPPQLSMQSILANEGYHRIKFRKNRCGYLCITGKIDDTPLRLVIDTGSPTTNLAHKRTEFLLNWRNSRGYSDVGLSDTSDVFCDVSSIELESFRTGKLLIHNHDLTDVNKIISSYGDEPIDGILGADVLGRSDAVIDYKSCDLYLSGRGEESAGGR
jgi:hypothetical protein